MYTQCTYTEVHIYAYVYIYTLMVKVPLVDRAFSGAELFLVYIHGHVLT